MPTLCCRLEVQAVSLVLLRNGVPDKYRVEEDPPPREHPAVIQQGCGLSTDCLCAVAKGPKEQPAIRLIVQRDRDAVIPRFV